MIQIKNNAIAVTINPFGAELHSILVQGEERLWQGDPSVWSGRAPVLFPVAGSFKNLAYTYNGVTYSMVQHGFARTRMFSLQNHTHASATFILQGKEANYPFDYCLAVTYELPDDNAALLRVTYQISNLGEGPMYYGIGAHEAYACPEGIEHYTLHFPADKVLVNHLLTGPQRNRQTEEMPLENGTLKLSPAMFDTIDTLVFPELRSRSVTLRHNDSSRFVRVDFEGFDNLLLWQKRGAKYFCIEPWSHAPEFTDHDGDITHKPGVRCLQAHQSESLTHTITFG